MEVISERVCFGIRLLLNLVLLMQAYLCYK